MKPIYLTILKTLDLMVMPDTDAHVDGHPVITRTYSIYKGGKLNTEEEIFKIESELHLKNKHHPDYIGEFIIERPGRIYNFIADGHYELKPNEVRELVEQLNDHRDNPDKWIV